MKTVVTLSDKSDARDVLELPKGRLMVGELVADFSPENVVAAARSIIAHCEHEMGEHEFYSQAGVLELAGNDRHWNSRPEYKAI